MQDAKLINFGIVYFIHSANDNQNVRKVVFQKPTQVTPTIIKKSSKLCLHCLLRLAEEEQFNYHLVFLYAKEELFIYKKLGLLIAGSFFLLLILVLLFRQMLQKYHQERRLSEVKNDFINNLSHEMQTPVFAVQMANRLIKEVTNYSKDLIPFTTIIEKETNQLKNNSRKILQLVSMENEQLELQKEDVDLNAFIQEGRPTIELMVKEKLGKLDLQLNKNPIVTSVDVVHLNNLLRGKIGEK